MSNYEALFRQKDGSLDPGIMCASLFDLDGVPHILSVSRSIADRKQAEEALRESEEKYRILVENAIESVSIIQDGMLKYVNDETSEAPRPQGGASLLLKQF